MEKAYIILAHKNPEQVEKLISSLDDKHSHFFLHVDKNAEASGFRALATKERVTMVEKVATHWGSFGIVQATLNAMEAAWRHPVRFDYFLLISGQHYPIKSNPHIHEFLRTAKYHVFLEYTPLPNPSRWKIRGGLYRIDKYFFGLRSHQRFTAKALNFLSSHIGFLRRKFPEDMQPYAGSQWWTMDRYAVDYVLNFLKENELYKRFHQHTFAPDELFFHNILLNAQDDKLRNGIANGNLLFMKWPDLNSGHPETLNRRDLQDIINSEALFARKFDMEYDAEILRLIDEYRLNGRMMTKTQSV